MFLSIVGIVTLELSLVSPIQPTKGSTWFATGAPCAKFTYNPILPYANETVTFDASFSTAGGGGIISYLWDFGDGINGTGVHATKIYTQAGNYTVILTITDSEGAKDTTWKVITVMPQPDEVAIDLYTQKGGQGRNQPDGAFALGETVILTALLTYNESPVQNKLVGFEVSDAGGEVVLDRSAFTDANGLATVNFTIPVLCLPDLPNIFGKWTALATASVSQQSVNDALTFTVRGPYIDLYTQKEPYGGRGPNQPSDAFAPQEEVILYAYVSYSCELQQNRPVRFYVINPKGEIVLDRTAFSNSVGIANITFRIPWPCENPEETIFGVWKVIGIVSILNLTAQDTLTFEVGWIINIIKLEILNATGEMTTIFAKEEHMRFNLTIRNIAFLPKVATLIVVAYDERSVPLGCALLHNWVIPQGTSEYLIMDIQIPQWAYIGTAAIYANAYTELPHLGGTPYCPEVQATFTIIKP